MGHPIGSASLTRDVLLHFTEEPVQFSTTNTLQTVLL